MSDYHEKAMRTAAGPEVLHLPQEPANVAALNAEMFNALLNHAKASSDLDRLKSRLFYGKEKPYRSVDDTMFDMFGVMAPGAPSAFDVRRIPNPQFIHAILGIASEGGELIEDMLRLMVVQTVEQTLAIIDNVSRETGDVDWYQELLATATGVTVERAREMNIARLAKRYPDKFSEEAAIARADEQSGFNFSDRNPGDELNGDGA